MKIDALHEWSNKWTMPFNTKKCEVIILGKGSLTDPEYTLGGIPLKCVQQTRYLGVEMQSNLRFEQHITTKIKSASKVLGCIKYSLHEAPEKGKLLAYTSLCRPILEYADTLWDPSDNTSRDAIEHVQSQAVRFIKNVKGRCGVTEVRTQLELKPLEEKRKPHRLSLLMRILSDKSRHQTLASAYEELVTAKTRPPW